MSDHLSAVEANAICIYADRCLKTLHLSYWAVYLAADPCSEHCHASITPTDGRYVAMLHVPASWSDKDEYTKRATVMHECLHLAHAQLDNHTREVLENNSALSRDVWDAFYEPFKMHCEYLVDQLTTVMRTNRLLPKWPTEKQVRKYMAKHDLADDTLVPTL